MNIKYYHLLLALLIVFAGTSAHAQITKEQIFNTGKLKPVDSVLKVAVGDEAPNFSLPSILGPKVRLSAFRRNKNVVLSFVPAAFTPICSDQWPGYNISKELFDQYDAILLGITVDNIPSLYAWTSQMGEGGVWFPVLSDFWPHGNTAKKYGIFRSDGVSERAIIIIDKMGIIRFIDVHDINKRPDLGMIIRELQKLD